MTELAATRIRKYFSELKDGIEIRLSKYQMKRLSKGQSFMVIRAKTKYWIGPKKGVAQTQRQIKLLQQKIKELRLKQK